VLISAVQRNNKENFRVIVLCDEHIVNFSCDKPMRKESGHLVQDVPHICEPAKYMQ
jgi:hypothetical protein